MFRLGIIIGTRPEAIKLAPLVAGAAARPDIELRVIATDQHADMCQSIFTLFNIKPHHHLGIMKPGQSLNDIVIGVMGKLGPLFAEWRPDWLIVQGDTSSAFTAGLAAFHAGVRVAHVEAGLRSGNIEKPWPEEMNRLLLSRIASLHFAPTQSNADTLLKEQVRPDDVFITGNTGIDALYMLRDRLAHDPSTRNQAETALAAVGLSALKPPFVLVTAHRRESFGGGLDAIMSSIARLAQRYPDRQFILPVHPNPVVKETVQRHLGNGSANIILTPPLDYLPFVTLMAKAELLLTDSGGLQEEGPSLGKRVIVMRDITERQEGLATPLVRLAGTDPDLIESLASAAFTGSWSANVPASSIYGDGTASRQILDILTKRGAGGST